jgi:hypothetical protein
MAVVTLPAPAQPSAQGHCNVCGRIWTLTEGRGICQWCSKPASCQTTRTKPRRFQCNRRQRPKQVNGSNNGYDQLSDQQGWIATPNGFRWGTVQWATLYGVAARYAAKAKAQDTEDLLHDILLALAQVAQRKEAQGQPFSIAAMHRTAEHVKDWYWYKHYAYTTGLDCRHCTKEQQAKCRYNWAHSDWAYADCHRAIQLESINQPITDSEGNITELGDLIADDKALDLTEWVDARTFLIGAPIRLKAIARKRLKGETLTETERSYLSYLRKKRQKVLV